MVWIRRVLPIALCVLLLMVAVTVAYPSKAKADINISRAIINRVLVETAKRLLNNPQMTDRELQAWIEARVADGFRTFDTVTDPERIRSNVLDHCWHLYLWANHSGPEPLLYVGAGFIDLRYDSLTACTRAGFVPAWSGRFRVE